MALRAAEVAPAMRVVASKSIYRNVASRLQVGVDGAQEPPHASVFRPIREPVATA